MCDLNLSFIPTDGKIALVTNGIVHAASDTRRQFQESARFGDVKLADRGWAASVLAIVRKICKPLVTNADLFAYIEELHAAYPGNNHIREKIRQQMQLLMRLGYVERISRGEYQVIR